MSTPEGDFLLLATGFTSLLDRLLLGFPVLLQGIQEEFEFPRGHTFEIGVGDGPLEGQGYLREILECGFPFLPVPGDLAEGVFGRSDASAGIKSRCGSNCTRTVFWYPHRPHW